MNADLTRDLPSRHVVKPDKLAKALNQRINLTCFFFWSAFACHPLIGDQSKQNFRTSPNGKKDVDQRLRNSPLAKCSSEYIASVSTFTPSPQFDYYYKACRKGEAKAEFEGLRR
jgi:hypothetical protein